MTFHQSSLPWLAALGMFALTACSVDTTGDFTESGSDAVEWDQDIAALQEALDSLATLAEKCASDDECDVSEEEAIGVLEWVRDFRDRIAKGTERGFERESEKRAAFLRTVRDMQAWSSGGGLQTWTWSEYTDVVVRCWESTSTQVFDELNLLRACILQHRNQRNFLNCVAAGNTPAECDGLRRR